jgi:hypothetical protein
LGTGKLTVIGEIHGRIPPLQARLIVLQLTGKNVPISFRNLKERQKTDISPGRKYPSRERKVHFGSRVNQNK